MVRDPNIAGDRKNGTSECREQHEFLDRHGVFVVLGGGGGGGGTDASSVPLLDLLAVQEIKRSFDSVGEAPIDCFVGEQEGQPFENFLIPFAVVEGG
ncbi:unnamed protein product [Sympodiomycopsis kandeliae]